MGGFISFEQFAGNMNQTRDAIYNNSLRDHKGDFYGMLGSILSKQIQSGLPNVDEYRQLSQSAIKKNAKLNQTQLNESFANRGMGNSGAAMAAQAMLSGETSQALGQNEVQLSQMQEDYKNNALSQLLNLNSFGANAEQNQISNLLNLLGLDRQQYQFSKNLNFQKDNQSSDFAQLLGSVLGGGAQVGAAALLASDESVKENIQKVGISEEGIPIVEFNYKGDTNRYRGVIAQDVEKVKPEAVKNINGIKHVDYSQLTVKMETV